MPTLIDNTRLPENLCWNLNTIVDLLRCWCDLLHHVSYPLSQVSQPNSPSMATSLATQLAKIAANSKSTLSVKAQRAAHSKSLIWEPRVAATQTYQSLFTTCSQGFEELCQLDERFSHFRLTIFSEESQNQDRHQLTKSENAELDKHIEAFLRLVGSRLRLMPAIKSIEWLIRRFRYNYCNTLRPVGGTFVANKATESTKKTRHLCFLPSSHTTQFQPSSPCFRSSRREFQSSSDSWILTFDLFHRPLAPCSFTSAFSTPSFSPFYPNTRWLPAGSTTNTQHSSLSGAVS